MECSIFITVAATDTKDSHSETNVYLAVYVTIFNLEGLHNVD